MLTTRDCLIFNIHATMCSLGTATWDKRNVGADGNVK